MDSSSEKSLKKVLEDLRKQLKNLHQSYELELKLQKEICETLWELVQRYSILKKGQERLKTKDDDLSEIIEGDMLYAINKEIIKVHKSNKSLEALVKEFKSSVEIFENEVKNVDSSFSPNFEEGSPKTMPMKVYREIISNLFSCFSKEVSKLKAKASLLDESDIEALEKYQKTLLPRELLQSFVNTNLSYMAFINE